MQMYITQMQALYQCFKHTASQWLGHVLEDQRSIPRRVKTFFFLFLQNIQTTSEVQTATYYISTGGRGSQCMKLTIHFLLEQKLGMNGAIPLCCHGVHSSSFTFYHSE
jgi:hypothetical protein